MDIVDDARLVSTIGRDIRPVQPVTKWTAWGSGCNGACWGTGTRSKTTTNNGLRALPGSKRLVRWRR